MEKPDPQPCWDPPQAAWAAGRGLSPGWQGASIRPSLFSPPGFISGDPGRPSDGPWHSQGSGTCLEAREVAGAGQALSPPSDQEFQHFGFCSRNPSFPPPAHAGSSLPPQAGVARRWPVSPRQSLASPHASSHVSFNLGDGQRVGLHPPESLREDDVGSSTPRRPWERDPHHGTTAGHRTRPSLS